MLYSGGENCLKSVLNDIIQPPIINIESRKANMHFNRRMIAKNIVYLVVYFPICQYHRNTCSGGVGRMSNTHMEKQDIAREAFYSA